MAYADWTYYSEEFGGAGEQAVIEPMLERASDAIDALTFSRISAVGWDGLTEFQQEKVRRACCLQADFMADNADAIESAMSEYSINGVTMRFGNPSLFEVRSGVPVANSAMALLRATGLTSGMARRGEVRA